jgi:cellulose synthase/poly-beta-1,6-N-acetylglucosamine synthase-like glycosyltransferase
MLIVFFIFAALLIWFSYKSFRGGFAYLNYFRAELSKPPSNYAPFATVIVPCRGVDDGMDENLARVAEQDYPDYEVIFVVDDGQDAAVNVIKEVSRKATKDAKKIKLVVAPKTDGSSQKVENLREAVLHADGRSEVFVFADSDARPSKDWLRNLAAPLQDPNVGAATGYRWFISKRPTFGSEMRSVWNASIASALGPNRRSNFCWGGSMAIRRDTFEKIDMRERWHGTLSDDFAVTRAVKEAGLDIYFVPQALAASVEDCSFRETLEFTTRQMKITRVYATHLWAMSFFGSALFTFVMLAAFLIVIFSGGNSVAVFASIATIVLVSFFSISKSWLRLKAVRLVLREYDQQLRAQNFTQNTLWLLSPPLFLCNTIMATISRRMTWRGIRYELKSPTETVIIAD